MSEVEDTNMRKLFQAFPRGLVMTGLAGWLLVSCQSTQVPDFKEQVSQALDHYYKGEELQKKGEFEAAAAEYEASLAISPRPRVYYRLAQVQYRLNQPEPAVASLDQALKLSPGFREAQVLKQQLVAQGKTARPAVEPRVETAVLPSPPVEEAAIPEKAAPEESPSVVEKPGGEEIPEGTDIASETLNASTPAPPAPEVPPAAPAASSLTEKPRQPAEAETPTDLESVKLETTAVAPTPVSSQPPVPAESQSISQPPAAATPPRAEIEPILKQGREAGSQGNWEQAQALYKKALDTYSSDAELWYEYGYASFQLGRLQDSEEAFRKAVEIKPDYAKAFNDLGVTLEQLNHSAEALQAYQKAVDLGGAPDAYFNLALLQEKLGNYKASVELYEKYIGFDPSSSFAEFARQRIEKLRRLAY